MEQRERLIRDHRLELYTMAELCTRYGISRKTGYKSDCAGAGTLTRLTTKGGTR